MTYKLVDYNFEVRVLRGKLIDILSDLVPGYSIDH